jgi:hypothetical protein
VHPARPHRTVRECLPPFRERDLELFPARLPYQREPLAIDDLSEPLLVWLLRLQEGVEKDPSHRFANPNRADLLEAARPNPAGLVPYLDRDPWFSLFFCSARLQATSGVSLASGVIAN